MTRLFLGCLLDRRNRSDPAATAHRRLIPRGRTPSSAMKLRRKRRQASSQSGGATDAAAAVFSRAVRLRRKRGAGHRPGLAAARTMRLSRPGSPSRAMSLRRKRGRHRPGRVAAQRARLPRPGVARGHEAPPETGAGHRPDLAVAQPARDHVSIDGSAGCRRPTLPDTKAR